MSLDPSYARKQRVQNVVFSNDLLFQEALRLISYCCPYPCGDSATFHFKSLRDLQTHLKRDHCGATFCEICLNHRQTFLPEQTVYSPGSILVHAKSQHPGCEFCKGEKFYSIDELLYHMNQVHFKCIVCDRLDYRNEYYINYDSLNHHCGESHFPCEYPECKEQRFVVFGDEDELRLHWIEKHGRGRAVSIAGGVGPGGSVGANAARKKFRNKYPQSIYNTHVHFRGSRFGGSLGSASLLQAVHDYPDSVSGMSYNPRIHSQLLKRVSRENKMAEISAIIAKATKISDFRSPEYKAENVLFLKKIGAALSVEEIAELKKVSSEYKVGTKSASEFFDFMIRKNLEPSVCANLILLMPDIGKRENFIAYLKTKETAKQFVDSIKPPAAVSEPAVPVPAIPDQMFDLEKKPSLLHALFVVLNDETMTAPARPLASRDLPQSTLSAMENKINSLDRIQLTTLSEMRHHLLTLADGEPSWKHADEIVTLRPLLYRLLQVPESHRSREKELIKQGWHEFVMTGRKIFNEKFTNFELCWIKSYVTISLLRSSSIGPLEAKRGEFPILPMSAYFPVVTSQQEPTEAPIVRAPTRADFPTSIRPAPPAIRISSGGSTWNNFAHGLREEAFPELDLPVVSIPRGPDLSRPWNCPRCTYSNTRPHSMNCEICGIDRPDDAVEISDESVVISTSAPKRVKKKIILSSATQRDYKR